jgi:hypothetical protein
LFELFKFHNENPLQIILLTFSGGKHTKKIKKVEGLKLSHFYPPINLANGFFHKYVRLARLANIHQTVFRGLAILADIPKMPFLKKM